MSQDCLGFFRWRANNTLYSVWIYNWDLVYMCCQCTDIYNVKFSVFSIRCKNSEYLDNCIDCEDCFGCVWLKQKRYCILNKKYSKEDYEQLIGKIKQSMLLDGSYGKFFPLDMAYNWYNHTVAWIYYPKSKEQVLNMWWLRDDENESIVEWWIEIPDHINDIDESYINKSLVCKKTGKPYNYVKQAYDLHKKLWVPLSDVNHVTRILDRYKEYLFF